MSKISDKREQKQRVILEAAQKVFLSDGYISASMDTIAAEAHVTKQTVYRYFSSKEVLFQSTLKAMSQHSGEDFFDHLNNPDPKEALLGFALAFIRAHLSEQHLATIRLLIAESGKAPELASSFFPIGPNKTAQQLKIFCEQRFQMEGVLDARVLDDEL